MNALTARALSMGLVVAAWTLLSHYGRLPLQLWPVVVGLGCFVGAGGGMSGLQKSAAGAVAGVVWAMIYVALRNALGGQQFLDALVLGAVVTGVVMQTRVALLTYSAGTIISAATAILVVGTRAVNLNSSIRVALMLAIGTVLGLVAERVAEVLQRTKVLAAAGR